MTTRGLTEASPDCAECGRPVSFGGFVHCTRKDDGRRACRSLFRCTGGHLWWGWADRPGEPLELCPVPQLFR